MSNVFSRFHTPTGNEFYDKGIIIERELVRLCMNERIVPKKYRYVYGIPIINHAHRLMDYISAEMTLYPTSEELVERKKNIWQDAIICCEQIIRKIQTMIYDLPTADPYKFENVGKLLIEESKILRECRKNTKLQKSGK